MKTLILPKHSIHTGNLILVNQQYPYIEDTNAHFVPVLDTGFAASTKNSHHSSTIVQESTTTVLMNRRAVNLLNILMEEIHGWRHILPVSGWRSMQEQQKIWDDSLFENGLEFTQKFVAVPGHSEHQTGLAIDLGLKKQDIDFICPDFPYYGICQTFRSKAADFGFIERYPAGKESVTGIGHEPWHFRYVGIPHAAIMTDQHMTLEEYINFIKQYPYGKRPLRYRKNGQDIQVSYLKADPEKDTELGIYTEMPYSVSGNNVDGFIITEWRENHGSRTTGSELQRT